ARRTLHHGASEAADRRSFVVLLALLRGVAPFCAYAPNQQWARTDPSGGRGNRMTRTSFLISAAMLAVVATSHGTRPAAALDDGWRLAQAAEPQNEQRRPPGQQQRPGQAAPRRRTEPRLSALGEPHCRNTRLLPRRRLRPRKPRRPQQRRRSARLLP